MQREYEYVYLTGTETVKSLIAQGINYRTAYRAIKRGWYVANAYPQYPQHEGAGHFAKLHDPKGFVVCHIMHICRLYGVHPVIRREYMDDLIQDTLMILWERRHYDRHHWLAYAKHTVQGRVRDWIFAQRCGQKSIT
jgi:hypothetical protein